MDQLRKALESKDAAAVEALLAEDVVFSMPPSPSWYRGRADVGAFLARRPLSRPRRWRLVPVGANGQRAFAFYAAGAEPGTWVLHAIDVCSLDAAGQVTELVAFHQPEALGRFGLAPRLTG